MNRKLKRTSGMVYKCTADSTRRRDLEGDTSRWPQARLRIRAPPIRQLEAELGTAGRAACGINDAEGECALQRRKFWVRQDLAAGRSNREPCEQKPGNQRAGSSTHKEGHLQ